MQPVLADRFGVVQWFHFEEKRQVEGTIRALLDLGVKHLRTGISWADWYRPGAQRWFDWQLDALTESGLELLNCLYFTPPSLSMAPAEGKCSVPPAHEDHLAGFVDTLIKRYGERLGSLELWNEPNSKLTWDPAYDPQYRHLVSTLARAAYWSRACGVKTVLGGIVHLDLAFVDRMREGQVLENVDVMGFHAFPGMWEPYASNWDLEGQWQGWEHRARTLSERAGGLPVWMTEGGAATYHKGLGQVCREEEQTLRLREAMTAPVERFYWYSLFDLCPEEPAIEECFGEPREEAEYHLGLVRYNPDFQVEGFAKPAFYALRSALKEPLQNTP